MYYDHGYTVEQIHQRLRYPEDVIRLIIEKHKNQKNGQTNANKITK